MWNDWHIIMFRNTKWLSSTFTCFLINRLNILMHLKNNYQPRCTDFEGQGKGKGELLKTTWEIQIERVKSRFPFFTFATKINKWKKKAISQPKKKKEKKNILSSITLTKLQAVAAIWVTHVTSTVGWVLWSNCTSCHAWGHHLSSLVWNHHFWETWLKGQNGSVRKINDSLHKDLAQHFQIQRLLLFPVKRSTNFCQQTIE